MWVSRYDDTYKGGIGNLDKEKRGQNERVSVYTGLLRNDGDK